MAKIIDVFPFFAPYNEELLYLRVNLLKDHVDHFIIVESNKTHSGLPVERKFEEIARKQGLPMEKIIYVPHDIPETEDLELRPIDRKNAGSNGANQESVEARCRERLQKDAAMSVIDQFDNDDVFIYGDMDEIINPKNIQWVANMARNHRDIILKIPLVYLQGRADLRIHHRDNKPVVWWRAMFFVTREQLREHTFNNIRCGYIPLKVTWPVSHGKIVQDMGWHFAWMGNNEQRHIKATSFAHAHDKFDWMAEGGGYDDKAYQKFVNTSTPAEGKIAPDGNEDHILRRYPRSELPDLIFDTPMLKDFLLPETKVGDPKFAFNDCGCYWCQKLDWPLLYKLDDKRTWFEIPRSCSVTIKESFPNRVQVIRGTPEYDEEILQQQDFAKKPLVVFTDPIERFLSCLNVYLVPGQRYYDYGKDIFASFGENLETMEPAEKVDFFLRNLHKITDHHQVHHFHPQCRFVDTQNFDEFTVINKMEVSDFLKTEKHLNSTKYEIHRKDLSREQIAWIKKIYQSDYDFFKKYGNKVTNGKKNKT